MKFAVLVLALTLLLVTLLGCTPKVSNDTAGRYHQRIRVGNFFDRDDRVAGRYHQRTRVGNFFNRGTC
jgi:hypothetical protein